MQLPSAARLAAAALVAGACAAGAWGIACGLPENGLLEDFWDTGAPETGGAAEAAVDAPPSSCATIDAACLGGIPSGWQPVVVGDGGCGAQYTKVTMLSNARVDDGGCACGACRVIGSYTCAGPVVITSGDGCNDTPAYIGDAPIGECVAAPNGGAQHVEAHAVDAGGTVECFAPNDAGTGGTGDPVTVCYPGCAADFCAPGTHCILAEGDVVCPAGFVRLATAGSAVDPGCAPCGCSAAPTGPCGGSVTVFGDPACGDAGGSATYPVGDCEQYSTTTNFQSLVVTLEPPDASCALTGNALGGDASLVNASTICCK